MTGIFYGHRGAAGEAPENTLAGFAYARRAGVRAFEFDVRLSADGVAMLLHDEDLARTTGVAGRIDEHTAAELARLDARRGWPDWPDPAPVPTLAQVLEAHPDLASYQIEIKTATAAVLELACQQVAALVEKLDLVERAIVTSFEPLALRLILGRAPHIRLGLIAAYDRPEHLETALALRCWNACMPLATSSKQTVQQAQSHGLHVTGWLGNTVADLECLLDWEVDSITGDYPSVAIPYLRQQGYLDENP